MDNDQILIAVGKPRISQEIQRHLKGKFEGLSVTSEEVLQHDLASLNVLIIDDTQREGARSLLKKLRKVNSHCEVIIVLVSRNRALVAELEDRFRIFRTVPATPTTETLRNAVLNASRRAQLRKEIEHVKERISLKEKELSRQQKMMRRELQDRTVSLQEMRVGLTGVSRRINLVNRVLSKTHKCETISGVLALLQRELGEVLAFDEVIFGEIGDHRLVSKIKSDFGSSVVFPLVAEGHCLGHLYFVAKERGRFTNIAENLDVLSQIVDASALTMQKIKLFSQAKERKKEWAATFDAINSPLAIVDEELRIVRANKAYASRIGCSPQQIVEKSCFKVFAGREKSCEMCPIGQKSGENQSWGSELPQMIRGREYFASVFPVGSSNLRVVHYKDIAKEKALGDQLTQSMSYSAIGSMVKSFAQEITKPLNEILEFTQRLSKDPQYFDFCGEDLLDTEEAVQRCTHVVDKIIESLHCPLTSRRLLQIVDLKSLFVRAHSLLKPVAQASGIRLEFRVSEKPIHLRGNSHQLLNLIISLVLKGFGYFSSNKIPDRSIVVELTIKDADVLIGILYNGLRIEADAGSDSLSKCREIAHYHKGEFQVKSEEGIINSISIRLKRFRPRESIVLQPS
ncbi:PAS domain-containing protein [Bdellovibrionota bacterium]